MKYKIVLLEDRYDNHNPEKTVLGSIGCEVIEAGGITDPAELEQLCRDADALLVNLYKIDRNFISGLEKCAVIGRYGIGYDNVDVKYAAEKGIKVVNVPDYCSDEVSEHIIALLFSCVRNITVKDTLIRKGKWNIRGEVPVHRVSGKKLGIIGYGKTGQALHKKINSLGFSSVMVFDHHPEEKRALLSEISGNGGPAYLCGLDDLLAECDFISLNIPLTDETRGMIGSREFMLMKNTAIIINTSRGAVIDTEAMIKALDAKQIAGAAVDVHEIEPLPPDSPLFSVKNIVLTDHAAWYSVESQADLQRKCAAAVLDVLSGRPCASIVNQDSAAAAAVNRRNNKDLSPVV
ncbi:MAG: C-terminal binding protein [Spirochaetales bacterium]|nr:C-terminal binding protein [Spirochaetales bacterium]